MKNQGFRAKIIDKYTKIVYNIIEVKDRRGIMNEILTQLAECISHIVEAVAVWWLIDKLKEHKKQQKKKPSKPKTHNKR